MAVQVISAQKKEDPAKGVIQGFGTEMLSGMAKKMMSGGASATEKPKEDGPMDTTQAANNSTAYGQENNRVNRRQAYLASGRTA